MFPIPSSMVDGLPREQAFRQVFEWIRARTVAGALDITLVEIDDDHEVLRMPITDGTRQPYGLVHGGIRLLLAEEAASSHAAYCAPSREELPVGLEVSGTHLRGAREGSIEARARLIRRTRSLAVHEVEILHVETGELLTVARVTNLYRKKDARGTGGSPG